MFDPAVQTVRATTAAHLAVSPAVGDTAQLLDIQRRRVPGCGALVAARHRPAHRQGQCSGPDDATGAFGTGAALPPPSNAADEDAPQYGAAPTGGKTAP